MLLGKNKGTDTEINNEIMAIQDVMLIHKRTGFLIKHKSSIPGWKLKEQKKRAELISGMLTAIKGLVEEFLPEKEDNKGELKEIIHSENIIKIDSGRYTIMAVVLKLKGKPPDGFDKSLKNFHEILSQKYSEEFNGFNGSPFKNRSLNKELNSFFKMFN